MLTTAQLLDAAKHAQSISSEYRFARVLGIADNTLYNYRHGRTPDDERALRLAKMAGFDVGYVLICMAAERTKDDEARAAFAAAALAHESSGHNQRPDILPVPSDAPRQRKTPMPKGSAPDSASRRDELTGYTLSSLCNPGAQAMAALCGLISRPDRIKRRHASRALSI